MMYYLQEFHFPSVPPASHRSELWKLVVNEDITIPIGIAGFCYPAQIYHDCLELPADQQVWVVQAVSFWLNAPDVVLARCTGATWDDATIELSLALKSVVTSGQAFASLEESKKALLRNMAH